MHAKLKTMRIVSLPTQVIERVFWAELGTFQSLARVSHEALQEDFRDDILLNLKRDINHLMRLMEVIKERKQYGE